MSASACLMFSRAAPSFASRRRVTPAKASLGWAVYWLEISFCHTDVADLFWTNVYMTSVFTVMEKPNMG